MKLSEVLALLPKLSKHDLATVRAAADSLLDGYQREVVDETSPLYDAVSKLLGVGLTYRDFHNTQAYRSWKRYAPGVVLFIEETFPSVHQKVAKTAVMSFLIEMLVDDLKHKGVPVTLGTLSSNLDRLPQVFDIAFPNYREAGLAHLIVKAMNHK